MFAPAGRITARASRLCRLAALVVRRQALAPWNPDYVGRGRAGLKNRQDTFFDAPPTHSRLTAPPKKGFPLWGKLSPKVNDEGKFCGCRPFPRRGGVTPPYGAIKNHCSVGAGHCPALSFAATQKLRVTRPKGFPLWGKAFPSLIKPRPRGGCTKSQR